MHIYIYISMQTYMVVARILKTPVDILSPSSCSLHPRHKAPFDGGPRAPKGFVKARGSGCPILTYISIFHH